MLFHIAVFGSITVLAGIFIMLKKEYRTAYSDTNAKFPTAAEKREQDSTSAAYDAVPGGITPEETFGKFITALKAGDIALASGYIARPRQVEWQESFALLKTGGGLGALAGELETIQRIWKKEADKTNFARYTYKVPLHDGTISVQAIEFEKNDSAGAWEISGL